MKKLHKLAAAVAVAAGIALSPQANAEIELKSNGVGDALLFPAFNGYIENYFTISNHSNLWVQGHLRFRGAAWSAELRDFDVILSPGDVFVFRLADLDGDGQWEIDESLDRKNFQYTGMVYDSACQTPSGTAIPSCMKGSYLLEPTLNETTAKQGISTALIQHQRHVGYMEFIGEAVLNHMSHPIMNLLTSGSPDKWGAYVTKNGNGRGTSAWKWSAAEKWTSKSVDNNGKEVPATYAPAALAKFEKLVYPGGTGGEFNTSAVVAGEHVNLGLSDVGNVLSGTAFVTVPGQTHGIAYNAEAFTNFRTGDLGIGSHRIENYGLSTEQLPVNLNKPSEQFAVILHNEDASSNPVAASPSGDYVYGCPGSTEKDNAVNNASELGDELVVSFNNTWGPTLADGDDYLSIASDPWDRVVRADGSAGVYGPTYLGLPLHDSARNSIAEVEAAIVQAGTNFYSYYFDNDSFDKSASGGKATLRSNFFGYFPTKFFYGENINRARGSETCQGYIDFVVGTLVNIAKPIDVLVMDTDENPCTSVVDASISPARPKTSSKVLGHELSIFDIGFLKSGSNDSKCAGFKSGRAQISTFVPPKSAPLSTQPDGFPGLFYTFEIGSDGSISQWRAMQR